MQVCTRAQVEALNALYPEQYRCPWSDYEEALQSVTIPRHPVHGDDAIRVLGDRETKPAKFRRYTRAVRTMLLYEALKELPTHAEETSSVHAVDGSVVMTPTRKLVSDEVDFALILRAGEALVDRELMPKSRYAYFGLARDPKTLMPVEYLKKLPPGIAGRKVHLLDPMVATGNSVDHAVEILIKSGVTDITLVCVFAAVPGVLMLKRKYPQLRIVAAALHPILNRWGYIVWGCGDFGDRFNGTVVPLVIQSIADQYPGIIDQPQEFRLETADGWYVTNVRLIGDGHGTVSHAIGTVDQTKKAIKLPFNRPIVHFEKAA